MTFDEIIEIMNELNSDFSTISVDDEDYQEKFEYNISNDDDDENSIPQVTTSFGSPEKKRIHSDTFSIPFMYFLLEKKYCLWQFKTN